MDDPDVLARLTARFEMLESRVSALERSHEHASSVPAEAAAPAALQSTADTFSLAQEGGVFAVLGKAMLGIAGAYLLRAVAESGSFPKLAVVVLALAYAGMWLVWATRVPATARFTSTVYATTSMLILAPMLSELTLRFKVLPSSATAGILGLSAVAAFALAWKRSLTAVVWVSNVAAVLVALSLLIATHDLVPFLAALVTMSLAGEVAAGRSRWLGLRPVIAAAADLALAIVLYIYSRPEGIPPGYKIVAKPCLLGLGCSLLLIYGGGTVFRTMRLRQKITAFEIGQTFVAFHLAAFSMQSFRVVAVTGVLGTLCFLLSIACYTAAYSYFDRFEDQRNYHVYATWSAALFVAGGFFSLPPLLLAFVLSVAAVVATLLGMQIPRLTLQFHGLAYLVAAAYASGLLDYEHGALTGTFPPAPAWIVWLVALSAVACYAAEGRSRAGLWKQRVPQLLSAILAVAAVITFLISAVIWLAALGISAGAPQVAAIRTLVTCLVALALAFSSSRWQRSELLWIAYGILALVAAKLVLEDLQQGNPGWAAMSIFLFAVALIFVPRLARVGRQLKQAPIPAMSAIPD